MTATGHAQKVATVLCPCFKHDDVCSEATCKVASIKKQFPQYRKRMAVAIESGTDVLPRCTCRATHRKTLATRKQNKDLGHI